MPRLHQGGRHLPGRVAGTAGCGVSDDQPITIPIDQIETLTMTLGHQCHVVESSEASSHVRTVTITTETGIVCTFKGVMEFTYTMPTEPVAKVVPIPRTYSQGTEPGYVRDAEIDRLRDELGVLRGLLWSMTDDDACDLDHHGYCQMHNWFSEERCPNARAIEYFDGKEPA